MIINGGTIKQENRLSMLINLLAIAFIIFSIMLIIRGQNLFRPFAYLKKQTKYYNFWRHLRILC